MADSTSNVVHLPPRQCELQSTPAPPAAPDPVVGRRDAVDLRQTTPARVNGSPSGQSNKVIQRLVQPDPAAGLRQQLRQQLSGNEFKVADLLLGRHQYRYTGTVPQAAQAAGLSLRQCERARSSLRKKGLITVRMNGKRANRGRHNSTMLLNPNWPKTQRKRALTPHSDFQNMRLADSSTRNGGATRDSIREREERKKEVLPPAEPAAVSPPSSFSSRREPAPGNVIRPVAPDRGPGAGTTDLCPGRHPDFMRGHAPVRSWRDMPNLTRAQRLVYLWEELKGRSATGEEKGLLKRLAGSGSLVDGPAEEVLEFWFHEWGKVGRGVMDWADAYPDKPSLRWLSRHLPRYLEAWQRRADLDWLASEEAVGARRKWRERQGVAGKAAEEKKARNRWIERKLHRLTADSTNPEDMRYFAYIYLGGGDSVEEAVRKAKHQLEQKEHWAKKDEERRAKMDQERRAEERDRQLFKDWAEAHPLRESFENELRSGIPGKNGRDWLRKYYDTVQEKIEQGVPESDARAAAHREMRAEPPGLADE